MPTRAEECAERAIRAERVDTARKWFARMKDVLVATARPDDAGGYLKVAQLTHPEFANELGIWWNDPTGSTHLTSWAQAEIDMRPRRFA